MAYLATVSERLVKIQGMRREQPRDGFLCFAEAQEYRKLGQLSQAIASFEELRALDPKYVGLYYHLADVYEQHGEHGQAEQTYRDGIEVALELNDQHALAELRNAYVNWQLEQAT